MNVDFGKQKLFVFVCDNSWKQLCTKWEMILFHGILSKGLSIYDFFVILHFG